MLKYHHIHDVCIEKSTQKIKLTLKLNHNYDSYTKEQLINELVELKNRPLIVNNNVNNNVNIIVPPALATIDNYDEMILHLPALLHEALSKHPANFITYMIRHTTCNPKRPIYNSVKITNKKDHFAQISDGHKFVHITKKKMIEQLIDTKRGILQEYVDQNGDKYGVKILTRYQNYLDALDGDKKLLRELEDEIVCMLLDISDIIGSEEWSRKLLEELKEYHAEK
jgi:hypothetical protein